MKKALISLLFLASYAHAACPSPTPGSPHFCISWGASSTPSVTYNVYRATSAGGENYSTPLNSSPISALTFYDTTAVVGTNYFYTVTAVGTGGVLSAPSSEASGQLPVPPGAPTGPTLTVD